MRKKVVTIGGGSGSFNLLKGLKKYIMRTDGDDSLDLSFIVASTDSGGSSGSLRDEFGILPPGDIRQGLVALSDAPKALEWLFGYRFKNEKSMLNGHNVGNLIMTALKEYSNGDEQLALDEAHKILNVKGHVMPSTWNKAHITALYENGTILKKEHLIDTSENLPLSKIKMLSSSKIIKANPVALEKILEANSIIIGPGDVYTSLICNFLAKGLPEAIKESGANVIYNCNIVTKPSETPNYSVVDHVNDIEKYLGEGILDIVTYNNNLSFDKNVLAKYKEENKGPVRFDLNEFKDKDMTFVGADFLSEREIVRHDSEKLGRVMMDCIFPLDL